ncbi:MAG: glyoxalase [Verrucomicrobiales bacterium]|nr:glyoxalase [Verrucomicrobiales bacterium]
MKAAVKPIPDGFHSITPYLTVKDGARALEFYKRAFGATERFRMNGLDGKSIGHAEIVIGNSIVMLADESPLAGNKSPETLSGTPVSLLIYVENVDSAFERAVDSGATVVFPVENKFYGERAGCLKDPFGHMWTLMTHIEDLTSEELNRRMLEFGAKMGDASNETSQA